MPANLFTIMPRVLSHFGDELIRNEIIALTELAKNSYDANAGKCVISFYFDKKNPLDYKPLKIVIEDNGDGMTKDDIINYWLTVGTDHKKRKLANNNRQKRIPLGEKGIGRFGVHKLGEKITVTTKTVNNTPISFTIDWAKLEDAQSFEDFGVLIKDDGVSFKENSGLTYVIEEIKGEWTRKKLRDIHRALTALNIKFSKDDCKLPVNSRINELIKFNDEKDSTSDQFIVQVKSQGNKSVFVGLKGFDEIKGSACYECDILLSGSEIVEFQYRFHPIGLLSKKFEPRLIEPSQITEQERTLQRKKDKHELAETYKGLFKKDCVLVDLSQEEIGDVYIKLFAFEKSPAVKKAAGLGRDVDEYLKENGGIRIYRDGVRVYDYGEKGNDWLELNSTGDIGNKLRNEHVVGYVFLNRKQSKGLIEKTNREGFIENNAYLLLCYALKWAIKHTFLLYRNRDKDKLSEYYTKASEPVIALLEGASAYIEKNIEDEEQKNILYGYLDRVGKEYKSIVDMLYQSAGVGILSSSIVHEIEKLIKEIYLQIDATDFKMAKLLVARLEDTVERFSLLVKKTDIKKHTLGDLYEHALRFTKLRLGNHSISASIDGDSSIKCSASINHATNVLLNIIDNSVYWINNTREQKKIIKLYMTDNFLDGYGTIIIADNGPGFSSDPKYLIKPFVSTKPYSVGSGLGLYIADELMSGMKGLLSFPDFEDVSEYFANKSLRTGAVVALNFKKVK